MTMPSWTAKAGAWALAAALTFGAGMATGWKLWHPRPATPETYAREVRQGDGSLVLERKPQADAKPAQEIPKGGKVERVGYAVVQPHGPSAVGPAPTSGTAPGDEPPPPLTAQTPPSTLMPDCPPVRLDWTLIREKDGGRRVIVSSPDGRVIEGADIPIQPDAPPKALKWTASVIRSWDPSTGRQNWGAMVQRDFGPFAVHVGGWNGAAFAGVGIRF